MSQKGISLPIEMIIIIAVAVLVLIVIVAFFLGGWKGGTITDDAAFTQGCVTLKYTRNCVGTTDSIIIPDYTPPGWTSANPATLRIACQRKFGAATDDLTCRELCACPR